MGRVSLRGLCSYTYLTAIEFPKIAKTVMGVKRVWYAFSEHKRASEEGTG